MEEFQFILSQNNENKMNKLINKKNINDRVAVKGRLGHLVYTTLDVTKGIKKGGGGVKNTINNYKKGL